VGAHQQKTRHSKMPGFLTLDLISDQIERSDIGIPSAQNAEFFEFGNDDLSSLFGTLVRRADHDLGILRLFIRAIDTGKVGDLARTGLFIKALHIALFTHLKRGVDKDLDKLVLLHQTARQLTFAFKRRDKGHQRNYARINKQLGRFAHTADVFHPIRIGKAEVLVKTMADIIAIKGIGMLAHGMELFLHHVGNG